ncbi:MAG: SdrD B-like domain-containing protein, partial [Prochloraceae cyanobacterium]
MKAEIIRTIANLKKQLFSQKVGSAIGTTIGLFFAIYSPAIAQTVNGTVFEDTNGNNNLTLGEPGLGAGITIRLLDGLSRQELDITTTNINGQYSFLNVANGNYLVQVDIDTVPDGFIIGNNSNNITTTVNNNVITINYPFDPVNISGRVFEDTNLDDIQDNGEAGLSSITVFLFNDTNNDGIADGGAIATTETNFAGDYGFNVPNGNYLVRADTNDPDLVGRQYGGVTGNPNDPLNLTRNADINNNILSDLNYPFDPGTPPPICDPGDPNNQLSFLANPQLISGTDLQIGARYRFANVFPGVDALIEIAGFNGGATLGSLDNDSTGEVSAFQPTLNPPNAAVTSSVDFDITFVNTGTNIPVALTFKAAGLDIDGSTGDGNPNGLREFIQLTNLSSFTLDPNTALIATSIPPNATRFESSTTQFQPGISLNAVEALVITQYNNISQFRYTIGAINNTNSGIQRLNSFFLGCASIAPPSVDFGDAPDTYGTDVTAGNSSNGIDPLGASHAIVSGIQLGVTAPDLEADGQASPNAEGDDLNGTDDEDGINAFPTLNEGSISYTIPAANLTATNTTGVAATLHAWIDFNKNGIFEPTEYANATVNNNTNNGNPAADLTWNGIIVGTQGNTFARFRLTTDPNINANTPGGPANDGEVEDYQITIAPPVIPPELLLVKRITDINGTEIPDFVNDGVANSPDDNPNWPTPLNDFLRGAIDRDRVRPGDEV